MITWDDWGGWYDSYQPGVQGNVPPWPNHPFPNPYNQQYDANEWGFRVPFILISPYINAPGYVSNSMQGHGGITARSQGAITAAAEDLLGLGTLNTDDYTNGSPTGENGGDVLQDMFNFNNYYLYNPIVGTPYQPTCTG
jgi:hypothetical protein